MICRLSDNINSEVIFEQTSQFSNIKIHLSILVFNYVYSEMVVFLHNLT